MATLRAAGSLLSLPSKCIKCSLAVAPAQPLTRQENKRCAGGQTNKQQRQGSEPRHLAPAPNAESNRRGPVDLRAPTLSNGRRPYQPPPRRARANAAVGWPAAAATRAAWRQKGARQVGFGRVAHHCARACVQAGGSAGGTALHSAELPARDGARGASYRTKPLCLLRLHPLARRPTPWQRFTCRPRLALPQARPGRPAPMHGATSAARRRSRAPRSSGRASSGWATTG